MFSRFLKLAGLSCLAIVLAGCQSTAPPQRALRVCADPNNLPFSNERSEGFENRIAELIAGELGARLEYTWFAQRRGFVRNTLNALKCDVVMGVPAGYDPVATTKPYYRSAYVFVTRPDTGLQVASLDDAVLRRVNIGVHVVGDDYANPPPVHALSRRHIIHNVLGFTLYGDYSKPNPPARLIEAVASGNVDVAIAWGPFGGYFASKQHPPLKVALVQPDTDSPGLPFAFDIAMGVRKQDQALRDELNRILDRRLPTIHTILREFAIPFQQPGGAG